MTPLNIPVILGTGRQGRRSENAARYMLEQAHERRIDSQLIDVRDFATPFTVPSWEEEEHADKWRRIAKAADGFIIVTPEYNHGYPGELKLLLDKAYDEYATKPVGICGVSNGGFGGTRVVENLRPVLIELMMVPVRNAVYFSRMSELFGEQGNIKDASFGEKVEPMFDELMCYARILRASRDKAELNEVYEHCAAVR